MFDATTLGWLVPVVVALYLPRLLSFEFGGLKITLAEKLQTATKTAVDFKGLLAKMAGMLENWTSKLGAYRAALNVTASDDEATALINAFYRDRLWDVRQWLDAAGDGEVRSSIWIFDPDSDELLFCYSNEISDRDTTEFAFASGVGILGKAFQERQLWNVDHATVNPAYVKIRSDATYKAILVTPMSIADEFVGMLAIDRTDDHRFSPTAEVVARALANICALAYKTYKDRPLPDSSTASSRRRILIDAGREASRVSEEIRPSAAVSRYSPGTVLRRADANLDTLLDHTSLATYLDDSTRA